MQGTNYSSIIIDMGNDLVKVGFSGEDDPRNIFNSIPKMTGLRVGMEQKKRYAGYKAISNLDIMNFFPPVQRGEGK